MAATVGALLTRQCEYASTAPLTLLRLFRRNARNAPNHCTPPVIRSILGMPDAASSGSVWTATSSTYQVQRASCATVADSRRILSRRMRSTVPTGCEMMPVAWLTVHFDLYFQKIIYAMYRC